MRNLKAAVIGVPARPQHPSPFGPALFIPPKGTGRAWVARRDAGHNARRDAGHNARRDALFGPDSGRARPATTPLSVRAGLWPCPPGHNAPWWLGRETGHNLVLRRESKCVT
jgi:hypothetical protein